MRNYQPTAVLYPAQKVQHLNSHQREPGLKPLEAGAFQYSFLVVPAYSGNFSKDAFEQDRRIQAIDVIAAGDGILPVIFFPDCQQAVHEPFFACSHEDNIAALHLIKGDRCDGQHITGNDFGLHAGTATAHADWPALGQLFKQNTLSCVMGATDGNLTHQNLVFLQAGILSLHVVPGAQAELHTADITSTFAR